jgi:DNA ligase-1
MTDPCYRVISALEDHNARTNKEQIIEVQARAGNKEFFEGCKLALDPMITFGIKQVPERDGIDGPGVDWDTFTLTLTGFVNRSFTGNLGRETLNQLMSSCTNAQWNGWYRRILIKDLRCGVSEKTINKVVEKKWPEYAVPIFSCQLAHDSANHESKVAGKKLIEVKLDGVRIITIVYPDGRVDQFSRNGKELVNFPHLKDQLGKIASGFTEPMVLDGEVMSTSFQDLMKQVHRKSDVNAQDALLYLFDALPLTDFEKGKCNSTQEVRSQWLKDWYNGNIEALPNFRTLAQELVDLDTEAGQKRFRAINQSAIDGGYEGIMIKEINAPYECKRSVAWLKLKPFIEVSLSVIGVEEGTGKNEGKMGAIICEGEDDGKLITVNVGSGFTDDNRDAYWTGRNKLLGMVAEVRADAITQNQDGTYSLRFPRFKGFRGFAVGEKM